MDTYNNVYDLEIYHFFDVFQVIPFKLKSFNSHDWPKQNFFLQFEYNLNHKLVITSDMMGKHGRDVPAQARYVLGQSFSKTAKVRTRCNSVLSETNWN